MGATTIADRSDGLAFLATLGPTGALPRAW